MDKLKAESSSEPQNPVIVPKEHTKKLSKSVPPSTSEKSITTPQPKKSSKGTGSRGFDEKHLPHTISERQKPKEIERQIIEKELQRQRMMAISGHTRKTEPEVPKHPTHPHEIIRLKREVQDKTSLNNKEGEQSVPAEEIQPVPKKRRIIIQKKPVHSVRQNTHIHDKGNKDAFIDDDEVSLIKRPSDYLTRIDSEDMNIDIKNSGKKSRDHILIGKNIQKSAAPKVKDSVLIHTDLKSKKNIRESRNGEYTADSGENVTEHSNAPKKRDKNTSKKDDINWI
jgi:hypothetical protein